MAVPDARYDRDAGDGVGHLFKVAPDGRLLGSARIGSGTIYHPGGLDFDGRSIWVAVAEYRPNSRAIVYRVNPDTLRAAEVLRVGDHLGAVAYDTERRELHAVSWGARRFYRWTFGPDGELRDREAPRVQPNPSHYVDYQDCKYAGRERMLCSGVATLHRGSGEAPFRLGGLDLVSLRDGRPLHQVPVLLWTPGGLDMTHNAAWFEPTENGIRAYFMPEDGVSSVHVYDADGR